jgi:hypothetical protein
MLSVTDEPVWFLVLAVGGYVDPYHALQKILSQQRFAAGSACTVFF